MTTEIEKAVRHLGLDQLRDGQRDAIDAIVNGHDVLAVMPTGYGKSAIYQVAGEAIDGPTIIVSPLIALQHDQVSSLQQQRVGRAALANSTMSKHAWDEFYEALADDELEFAFLAPEQLARDEVVHALHAAKPSLFVVDEAHCISAWGHDFRPDYFRLGEVIDALDHPRVLALTATAAPPVQREIVESLHMHNERVFVRGFDRPNITFSVETFDGEKDKYGAVIDRATVMAARSGSGIIYVATRARADELSTLLDGRGVTSHAYHAGLPAHFRSSMQDDFMSDRVRIIVATNAFGMGVDKPGVRFVLHADVPDSIDAYYQEAGRCGRDGAPAEATLFYRQEDLSLRRFFNGGSGLDHHLEHAIAVVQKEGGSCRVVHLDEKLDVSLRVFRAVLGRLVETDGVHASGDRQRIRIDDEEAALRHIAEARTRVKSYAESRLDMMRQYAESKRCRRHSLLSYFGENSATTCAGCDNCESGASSDANLEEGEFEIGGRVHHEKWGDGQVMRADGDTIVVLFDDAGYRTLSSGLVAENDLLHSV